MKELDYKTFCVNGGKLYGDTVGCSCCSEGEEITHIDAEIKALREAIDFLSHNKYLLGKLETLAPNE